jgi:hypothetical protein
MARNPLEGTAKLRQQTRLLQGEQGKIGHKKARDFFGTLTKDAPAYITSGRRGTVTQGARAERIFDLAQRYRKQRERGVGK